jgi:hypothetical protein
VRLLGTFHAFGWVVLAKSRRTGRTDPLKSGGESAAGDGASIQRHVH